MRARLSRKPKDREAGPPPEQASETDDGYLSASEIAALKLDADWVTLSACNTAAGNAANAEALSGLARAFIYAQARAMLAMIDERDAREAHPAYWAPFVVVGEGAR